MRKVEHYICDICGTEYADASTAEKCEKYHVKPKKVDRNIGKNAWTPVTQRSSDFYKYPKQIKVIMDDDTVCIYAHISS